MNITTFLLIFYVTFSYLVLFGIRLGDPKLPIWNMLISPIALPMLLGKWLTISFHK